MMKFLLPLALGSSVTLSSCVAYAPPPPPTAVVYRKNPARSPYSPGGTAIVPRERNPRSPYSPGGSVVLPREARRTVYRGNTYFVHRNVWYRSNGPGYVIVRRPY